MITNILILLTVALATAYTGLCVYALLNAKASIFPAPKPSYTDSSNIIKLVSSDGERISAIYLEAVDASQLILYSHGNGEDLGHIQPFLKEFQSRGISVFTYDYPGYGTSTGEPSESGSFAAADAAYIYVTEELGFGPDQVILYGRSLGSGPSCWLAERYPVKGLIMDSAFTSTFRVLTNLKLLPWDVFDNIKRLPNIDCKILIIHGRNDRTVPFTHALRNEKAAKNVTTHWTDSGHNDLPEVMGNEYWELVLGFIQSKD